MLAVNKILIQEKCETIIRCIQRVEKKLPPSRETFAKDQDAQDIVSVNLERAVQSAVDIAAHLIAYTTFPAASTMADSFSVLEQAGVISSQTCQRMRKAVGLRNILVHEYKKIDWSIVWIVGNTHLIDFSDYCKEVLNWATNQK